MNCSTGGVRIFVRNRPDPTGEMIEGVFRTSDDEDVNRVGPWGRLTLDVIIHAGQFISQVFGY